MNRREALERVALVLGGTVIGGAAFLDEVAETIIPTTDTPGAKAAKVGEFMNVMVTDCYEAKDQKIFTEGLGQIDAAAKHMYSKGFMDITPEQRTGLLNQVNKELKAYNDSKKDNDPNHYFGMMKQLTLLGYFTSEVGATKALRYVAVPGKYEGCIPYAKGDRAWA